MGITMTQTPLTEIPNQKEVRLNQSVFGKIGENHDYCNLPYPMKLAWDLKVKVNRFTCHALIKPNLELIFAETLDHYGISAIERMGLDLFGGCFNNRNSRNGKSKSMHAWAIAVDLDPTRNRLRWDANKARFALEAFNPFWDIVEANGGVSLGREWGKDWMHLQFAGIK